jgi:dolichol-phosphate mannosyltransferase
MGIGKGDLTVLIPTLNEAGAIGQLIDELKSRDYNILVVDGRSTDGTVEIVRSKGIKLIFQEGKGKG